MQIQLILAHILTHGIPTKTNPLVINEVYRYDLPSAPADDNGLLHDGSVVIRDRQRLIKGKLYINDSNDNLVISSFLGGGIRILPNGAMNTDGELLLDSNGDSKLRSRFTILNNELFVDYTEHPEKDNNDYATSAHRYKVFHEGNLDVSAIKVLTPLDVYTKLLDPSLPSEFAFNVRQIGGKTIDELALLVHNHYSTDILDFNEKCIEQSKIASKDILTHATTEGITISYLTTQSKFKFSADSFNLTFSGGATGTGLIDHLTDTTIELTVDPTKHIHMNYVTKLEDLQVQINNINAMDPDDYYKKNIIDGLIDNVTGTAIPTNGKPLLVNSDLILPGIAEFAQKLDTYKTLNYIGDITGTLTTNFENNSEDITLSAENIVSNIATAGKALKLDNNLNLNANAATATKLNHTITLTLGNQLTGSVVIDTEDDNILLNATLNPSSNILQETDLGVRVASLGQDGKVPSSQLPASQTGLVPMGPFDPNDGYPSLTPVEGQFWIADTPGVLDGVQYNTNDWCVYLQSVWNHVTTSSLVTSVNGYTGAIQLVATDVGAIANTYIDYELGTRIPAGYIVRTTNNGAIIGASVSNLTNSFSVTSDTGSDIIIDPNSTADSTDGSSNLGLLLKISQDGYNNIKNEVVPMVKAEGTDIAIPASLNFTNGLGVSVDGDNNVTITGGAYSDTSTIIVHSTDTFLDKLLELYENRNTQAVNVIYINDTTNKITNYLIDSSYPDLTPSSTVSITPTQSYTEIALNTSTGENEIKEYNDYLIITTNADTEIQSVSQTKTALATLGKYIDTSTRSNTTTFLPSQDYQPATKKYVDTGVGTKQNTLTPGYNISIQNDVISSTARAIVELEGTQGDPVLGYNMLAGLYDVTGYYGILTAINNNTSHVLWYVSEEETISNTPSKTILELKPDKVNTYKLYKENNEWKLRDNDNEVVTKSNLNKYSTTEVSVGTWIDGKPLYRKVIDFGALSNRTTKNVPHNINNLKRIVKIDGYAYSSLGNVTYPIPRVSVDFLSDQVGIIIDGGNISISPGTDRTSFTECYVILEYTKTTD